MGKRKAGKRHIRHSSPSEPSGDASPQRRHRSRNRSRSRSPGPVQFQLKALKYVTRGNASRLRKLIRRTKLPLDLSAGDSQGRTLLHHACACGHGDVVASLMRYGAPASAVDAWGDTPAHLAARGGHLEALAEALQGAGAPSLDVRGADGATLRDLMAEALRGSAAGGGEGGLDPQVRAAEPGRTDEDEDDEARWRRRLREEFSDGEGAGEGWEDTQAAVGRFGGEDDDEWADRLWREMQGRRRAAAATSAAAFTADLRAEAARKAAAAAEQSQRILQEEQAKDAAWRRRTVAAIEAGPTPPPLDLSAARVAYDERWVQLDSETLGGRTSGGGGAQAGSSSGAQAPLRYWDIPWPLEMLDRTKLLPGPSPPPSPPPPPSAEVLRDFLLLGATGPADVKKRLRAELLRWHPDKFGARFGGRLEAAGPGHRDAALSRVQQLAQVLTQVLGRRGAAS